MTVIKQFNTELPAHFEANRTQVNVGIVPTTKTVEEQTMEGYEYITVCFESPEVYTDEAILEIAKKEARTYEVEAIKITIEKGTFHGNEEAQRRLKARRDEMKDGETWGWKDINGDFIELTKDEFSEIIKNAINKQDEYWVKYT